MDSDFSSCGEENNLKVVHNIVVLDTHNLDQRSISKNIARLNKKRKRDTTEEVANSDLDLYNMCTKTNRIIPSASMYWEIFRKEGLLVPMKTHKGVVVLRSLRHDADTGSYWVDVPFL